MLSTTPVSNHSSHRIYCANFNPISLEIDTKWFYRMSKASFVKCTRSYHIIVATLLLDLSPKDDEIMKCSYTYQSNEGNDKRKKKDITFFSKQKIEYANWIQSRLNFKTVKIHTQWLLQIEVQVKQYYLFIRDSAYLSNSLLNIMICMKTRSRYKLIMKRTTL